jgi:hypothetical protein
MVNLKMSVTLPVANLRAMLLRWRDLDGGFVVSAVFAGKDDRWFDGMEIFGLLNALFPAFDLAWCFGGLRPWYSHSVVVKEAVQEVNVHPETGRGDPWI